MDKDVEQVVNLAIASTRVSYTTETNGSDLMRAIARVEARLIPEDARERVARWLEQAMNPVIMLDGEMKDYPMDHWREQADAILATLTDRERPDADTTAWEDEMIALVKQDAAPHVPGEHIDELELTFEHVGEGTALLVAPPVDTSFLESLPPDEYGERESRGWALMDEAAPPAPETCPECSGSGGDDVFGTCLECSGFGVVSWWSDNGPGGFSESTGKCPTCNGTGSTDADGGAG